jgi:hypothetical protein
VPGETGAPQGHFLLRAGEWARAARLVVTQDGHELGAWTRRLVPNRPLHLADAWLARVERDAGPVRVSAQLTG